MQTVNQIKFIRYIMTPKKMGFDFESPSMYLEKKGKKEIRKLVL
jgi:hypothetical protein